uniref:Uncharacterized protein LOC100176734 n=1 Tax=Phallusia mammillata TaxID=59560 RepID=A0A6F9DHF3_9ASCI|nr:uncharacterized protein LOC100176734 [Phallusia mammillata]
MEEPPKTTEGETSSTKTTEGETSSTKTTEGREKVILPYGFGGKMKSFDSSLWRLKSKQQIFPVMKKVFKKKKCIAANGIDLKTANAIKLQQEKCPHSAEEIQQFVRTWCRRVRKHHRVHDCPIDKWAEIIDAVTPDNGDLEQQLISSIMAASEENVLEVKKKPTDPQSSESFPEPNYSDIYRYLACAIANKPLPELSPVSALVVEECLQSLTEQIKTLEDGDLRKNLRSVYLFLLKNKAETANEEEEEVLAQLNSNSSLTNPLGVHQNAIIPVPPNI